MSTAGQTLRVWVFLNYKRILKLILSRIPVYYTYMYFFYMKILDISGKQDKFQSILDNKTIYIKKYCWKIYYLYISKLAMFLWKALILQLVLTAWSLNKFKGEIFVSSLNYYDISYCNIIIKFLFVK